MPTFTIRRRIVSLGRSSIVENETGLLAPMRPITGTWRETFQLRTPLEADQPLILAIAMSMVETAWHRCDAP